MRLLTFLGTGKYDEVPYRLHGQECRTLLCPIAIARITGATEIVAFVTDQAREKWFNELEQQAAAFDATCRPVSIGLPADEAGMWDLFRAVQSELTGPSVALDVTHAFRAIPFVAMAVAGFARATNSNAVEAIYYGAYEAKGPDGVVPIIELTSLVSVLDWTAAVGAFQRYGDASMIAELTSRNCRQLAEAGMKEAASALRHVASDIERASNDLLACRPRSVPERARQAQDAITKYAATTEAHAPAFHAVRETLRDALAALTLDTGVDSHRAMLEAQLAMVRWYVEHGRPLHALALSREWLVNLACILKELDLDSLDQRSEAERLIHDRDVPATLCETFDRVSQWRNDVLHCGMRESHANAARVLQNAKKLPDMLAPLIALVSADIPMTLLNFSHPITPEQAQAVEGLLGQPIERVIACPAQFDPAEPFAEQARALVDAVGLTPEQWQTAPLLVNLPSLSVIAGLVLAEIHGRAGYFPAVLRLRPVAGAVPTRFEAAEVINLQEVREMARDAR